MSELAEVDIEPPHGAVVYAALASGRPTRQARAHRPEEGHDVSVFLAGDGVQLIPDAVLTSLVGLGTGSLRESFDAVAAAGGRFYVSGMSSKARGVTEADLADKQAELAMPQKLVQLAFEADRTLVY